MATANPSQEDLQRLQRRSEQSMHRLRWLIPLFSLLLLVIFAVAVALLYFESRARSNGFLNEQAREARAFVNAYVQQSVRYDANALTSILHALRHDDEVADLFAARDRRGLLTHVAGLYKRLNRDYNITHFYFTRPDRVNLLRVHAPERHGDRIDRVTTRRAQRTGEIAHGIELGVLGTFTLRVVAPWHHPDSGELLGYVELGMEVDHVIKRLKDTFALDVEVGIRKDHLQRELWIDGMRTLGQDDRWDRFPDVVLANWTNGGLHPALAHYFRHRDELASNGFVTLERNDRVYRLLIIPLKDVADQKVAEIALLTDETLAATHWKHALVTAGTASLALGLPLIGVFFLVSRRIGNRLAESEVLLRKLARRDSLTELLNRRTFDDALSTEILRAGRFDHELSLLIIDIDHFKAVNDDHGHLAGDAVLQGLSDRLRAVSRSVDSVYRYGGEEFVFILPETGLEGATEFAERIRRVVRERPFELPDGHTREVTVSVGVVTMPQHGDNASTLIAAADAALYAAKRGGRDQVRVYDGSAEL